MTGSTRNGKTGRPGKQREGEAANVEICMYVTEGAGEKKAKQKRKKDD